MLKFTIDDLGLDSKYEFIKKDLRELTFFIELNYKKINDYDYRPRIDFIWDIGYFKWDKRIVEYWTDIIEENIDKFEYQGEELDLYLYIDFLNEFEDKCIEKTYEFEELVDEELKEIYGE